MSPTLKSVSRFSPDECKLPFELSVGLRCVFQCLSFFLCESFIFFLRPPQSFTHHILSRSFIVDSLSATVSLTLWGVRVVSPLSLRSQGDESTWSWIRSSSALRFRTASPRAVCLLRHCPLRESRAPRITDVSVEPFVYLR